MATEAFDGIYEQFAPVTADDWKSKIIKDLKGEAFDKLIWHSKEGIDVLPFYTKADNEKYQLTIPAKTSAGWQITERILVDNTQKANREALHALSSGATAIIFNLNHHSLAPSEVVTLLNGILLDIASVCFEHYQEENRTILENKVPNSCVAVNHIARQETITEELIMALQLGVEADFKTCKFHFYCGENYFFEIAKLRAFRWLWKQLCQLKNQPYQLFILSETGLQKRADADEYTNMLRNTTEAMSAVLGGSDAVIINSHDVMNGNTDFGKRIARNVHHILQQEAGFSEIPDVARGSYYIEYLTWNLAQKAWEKFRNG